MTSEVIGGSISRSPTTGAIFAMPTESCSLVLGKEWSFLSRLVTQAIRLGRLSFTIRLSDILLSWAYPHWGDFLKSRDKASKLPMAFDELFKVGSRFA